MRPLQTIQSIHHNHHRERRVALTFIDVVMTIMIVGLVAAVATPRFASLYHRSELRSAAMTLAQHLSAARVAAMSRSTPIAVVFDTANASYSVPQLSDPEHVGELLAVNLRDRLNSTVILTAWFNGSPSFIFGVDGLPRVNGEAVTSSSLVIQSGRDAEQVTLQHGWGTATSNAGSGRTLETQR